MIKQNFGFQWNADGLIGYLLFSHVLLFAIRKQNLFSIYYFQCVLLSLVPFQFVYLFIHFL